MRTFEVTSPGLRQGGKELAVGAVIECAEPSPAMFGKVREVETVAVPARTFEVSTPHRVRPKKDKDQ